MTRSVSMAQSLVMSLLPTNDRLLSVENITGVAVTSTDPFRFTSTQQNLAIAIIIAFTVLAFLVLCVRVAGRLSSHQFGLGKQSESFMFQINI